MSDIPQQPAKQLLHLVFGGELKSVASMEFRDLNRLDVVGIYPNYASAHALGKRKRRVPSTTPKCDTSSCICIGSLIRGRWHRRVKSESAVNVG
jgi:hypothetical protein